MKVIKSNKRIAEEEEERDSELRKKQIERELAHKSWKESDHFKYVIEVIDEEIAKANNNSAIPAGSFEERGQYSLAMAIAHERLLKIKKRLLGD